MFQVVRSPEFFTPGTRDPEHALSVGHSTDKSRSNDGGSFPLLRQSMFIALEIEINISLMYPHMLYDYMFQSIH